MAQQRTTRTILASEAKAKLAQLVDDAYARGTRYIIQRFDSPRAVLISLEDYQRLLAAEAGGPHVLREARPAYNLGQERSPEEVAALLTRAVGVPRDDAH